MLWLRVIVCWAVKGGAAVSRAASQGNGARLPHTGKGKEIRAHFCIKGSFVCGRPIAWLV